ncbi:hypothetical protein FACS1894187_14290 [Synergistales bacterium]|nr:hypothetical protein FACS1894187_14290 [Synergistales bacterium]
MSGGQECIRAVKEAIYENDNYHLVLMDYMMPDMDGMETFEILKEEIAGFDTPVVMLTADAVVGEREKFLNAGFTACLQKPIARRALEDAILRVLPEELVERGGGAVGFGISDETRREIERELSEYGVSLSEGLKCASGDFALYRQLALIFTERHEPLKREIETLLNSRDYKALTYRFHSLKSNAGEVGAVDCRNTAVKLERECGVGSGARDDYVRCLYAVLSMEWERARDAAGCSIVVALHYFAYYAAKIRAFTGTDVQLHVLPIE